MKLIIFKLYINTTMGAIFCHVNRIAQFIHLSPSITSGNQKWKGAAPIFIRRAELRIINANCVISMLLLKLLFIIIKMIENKRIVEAIA